MSKWVQHKSGQGEKWEVSGQGKSTEWAVDDKNGTGCHYLPKSEYIECSPPEEWVDMTHIFNVDDVAFPAHIGNGYRLRKVKLYKAHPESAQNCIQQAFIVEKRKP